MTREEFDIITNKIGCWFTHLKLNSFRKTFDGEVYPSSALGTDYDLFIHKLEKELLFEDNHSLPSNLDEAAEESMPEEKGFLKIDIYGGSEAVYSREQMLAMFKTGAKWMTGQGVILNLSIDELSCGAYNACVEQGLTSEDDVIVQIRKKQ